ncbi:hypothetical protein ACH5RR_009680 [Cinchona calisaya]|uniref:RING-type E3 ubiquitin transferase n=1 Tax=Cinchona calisaya TaxID=153742 RepID=A0ABD3AIH2_9GENT
MVVDAGAIIILVIVFLMIIFAATILVCVSKMGDAQLAAAEEEATRQREILQAHPRNHVVFTSTNSGGEGGEIRNHQNIPRPKKPRSEILFKGSQYDFECAICCSEAKQDVPSLPCMWSVLEGCQHWFHSDCIKMWLAINRTCPLCRKFVH